MYIKGLCRRVKNSNLSKPRIEPGLLDLQAVEMYYINPVACTLSNLKFIHENLVQESHEMSLSQISMHSMVLGWVNRVRTFLKST